MICCNNKLGKIFTNNISILNIKAILEKRRLLIAKYNIVITGITTLVIIFTTNQLSAFKL
ncbi:hypothetical protein [Thermohalobacter berrensis]|uniref:hypothetical protein n=1 Tax=Thermohalobacter berrensis TaxID=99594 RepID=UPI001600890F|nr:hypothetical protein [Thermohalobacter berrensis]